VRRWTLLSLLKAGNVPLAVDLTVVAHRVVEDQDHHKDAPVDTQATIQSEASLDPRVDDHRNVPVDLEAMELHGHKVAPVDLVPEAMELLDPRDAQHLVAPIVDQSNDHNHVLKNPYRLVGVLFNLLPLLSPIDSRALIDQFNVRESLF